MAEEKSPYLLQHANNPVDWFPWGDEAFTKAKAEDKPIFLSIGYSTCHWCHVMERETFEDEEAAAQLNKYFVSIKVDREERPDIDAIYMAVCQAMTGQGGWPLTIIMTPDKQPFFAGTYFPKTAKMGMPGVMELAEKIGGHWKTSKEKLVSDSSKVVQAINTSFYTYEEGDLPDNILDTAYQYFRNSFDSTYGGFGKAPKFPTPHNLSFLLRYWKQTGDKQVLEMVEKTLEGMYCGGMYDHIGFGFARYSTDQKWLVPHFEKMLYDNALLAIAYLEAFQATGRKLYARVAEEIFTYVLRDMTSPEGAFYSAEDADSEGVEGKFYVWKQEEVLGLLGQQAGEDFCRTYDITPGGNFEGANIPNLIKTGTGASPNGASAEGSPDRERPLAAEREILFQAREKRVHPHKDDKILTGWNGLMIAALAFGSRVLGKESYAQAAEKAVTFITDNLRRKDGRLLARYREGEAAYPAYADDYAYLTWGLLELFQATHTPNYLELALELSSDLIKYFWDSEQGGLFLYGSDSEELFTRPKEIYDGATPSANSVSALNFLRLGRLTGRQELEDYPEKMFHIFGGNLSLTPMGHTHFMQAVWFHRSGGTEVTLVGNPQATDLQELLQQVNKPFAPDLLLTVKNAGDGKALEQLVPQVAERVAVEGHATAYVCTGFACQPPVTDGEALASLL